MANFFSKLFQKKSSSATSPESVIKDTLEEVITLGGFDLAVTVEQAQDGYLVLFSGDDGSLVTGKEGLLLDSFQIFTKRLLQNKFPDQKIEISVDCDGFLENSAQELRQLAEKLKNHVVEKGGPSFVRALPPRDRKIVHRYLAEDERVKSQSVGDGFCKKIKITLANQPGRSANPDSKHDNEAQL